MKIKTLLQTSMTVVMLIVGTSIGFGQVNLSGTSYTETFDNISSGLPTGWSVRTSADATSLGTSEALVTTPTSWGDSGGAFKNFASADGLLQNSTAPQQNSSTDRALGIRSTSKFGDPKAAFVLQISNTSGFTNFELQFKLQSLDVTSPRTVTWIVDYAVGNSPTSFTPVNTSPVTLTTGSSSFTNTTVNVDFGSALDNKDDNVWIRIITIVPSTGSNNRPTSGIDDFSLNWVASSTSFTVDYSVIGANGLLSAMVDDTAIDSGDLVEQNKDVVFTAAPATGYRVKEWTLNEIAVVGNTTNNLIVSNLSENINVTVEFEEISLPVITFNVDISNLSGFNPDNDDIYMTGDIITPNWIQPGEAGAIKMVPKEAGSNIYTTTLILDNGDYEYKYYRVINNNPSWDNGEPIASNRTITVSANQTIDNIWGISGIPTIGWANLQHPENGNINLYDDYYVYAQLWIDNVTNQPNPLEIVKSWIGFNSNNTDPSTWSNDCWIEAEFNLQSSNNHEYKANIGDQITLAGNYYYASRFQIGNGEYFYGGYNLGFWDGVTNVSGELIVNQVYTVNFNVVGSNGSIAATVDAIDIVDGQFVIMGKDVIFTATPATGYRVKEWTLNSNIVDGNTTNTLTVENITENITVTVEFEPIPSITYTLSYNVVGTNGTLTATVGGIEIESGDEVYQGDDAIFTATPATGYRVKEWTLNSEIVDGNTTNTLTVENITENITVNVEFEEIPPINPVLLVEDFDYDEGELLINHGWTAHSGTDNPITVVSPGLVFNGYIGSGVGNAAAVINNYQDVNKTFEAQTTGTVYAAFMVKTESTNYAGYFLHFSPNTIGTTFFTKVWVNSAGTGIGLGLGSSSPSTYHPVTPGVTSLVVIKFNVDTKESSLYVFDQFPESEPSIANSTFTEISSISDVGSIALRQYNANQRIIVDGIRIATTWEDAVKGAPIQQYTINFEVIGTGGSLTVSHNNVEINNGDIINSGSDISFTAIPDVGYRVKEWILNGDNVVGNTSNNLIVSNIHENIHVTVEFEPIPLITYTLSYNVVGTNGTLTATVGGIEIESGDEVNQGDGAIFTATPATGYRVKEWILNGDNVVGNTSNNLIVSNIHENIHVTVEFEPIPLITYTLSYNVIGTNGTLTATVGGIEIESGDEVYQGDGAIFTATPATGYRVKEWILNGDNVVGNTSNNLIVSNIHENIHVTVEFEPIPLITYTLSYNVVGTNGTLTATVGGIEIESGDEVNQGDGAIFTATPATGYRVKEWTLNSNIVDGNTTNTLTVENITENITVTVEFEALPQYALTINIVGDGIITVNGTEYINPLSYTEGTAIQIVANAAQNWIFEGWSGDFVSNNPDETFIMNQALTITATFTLSQTAQIIVGWDFDDENTIADAGVVANQNCEIITNTNGELSYTQGVAGKALTTTKWTDGADTKYWMIDFSTTGYENITISSVQRSSNTGPRDFKVQVKLDGTEWIDVQNTDITVENNFTSGAITDVILPEICENQGKVYLRWIMRSNISVNNTTVVNAGTSRIDNIYVKGDILADGTQYSVTLTKTDGGDITPLQGEYYYNNGTLITLNATPNEGYVFEGWSGDVISSSTTETLLVNSNKSVVANFRSFISATINPTTGDIYDDQTEYLTTVITWNDANEVTSITMTAFGDDYILNEGDEYTITDIDGNSAMLTFNVESMIAGKSAKDIEEIICEISFDLGESSIYTISYHYEVLFYVMFEVTSGGDPVPNAKISINNEEIYTDATGYTELLLANGTYPFTVEKDGYEVYSGNVTVNNTDQNVVINLISGITNPDLNTTIYYPNPVIETLTIERKNLNTVKLEIYSIDGTLVMTQNWTTDRLLLNLEALQGGVYTIRLIDIEKIQTLRIIKQ